MLLQYWTCTKDFGKHTIAKFPTRIWKLSWTGPTCVLIKKLRERFHHSLTFTTSSSEVKIFIGEGGGVSSMISVVEEKVRADDEWTRLTEKDSIRGEIDWSSFLRVAPRLNKTPPTFNQNLSPRKRKRKEAHSSGRDPHILFRQAAWSFGYARSWIQIEKRRVFLGSEQVRGGVQCSCAWRRYASGWKMLFIQAFSGRAKEYIF